MTAVAALGDLDLWSWKFAIHQLLYKWYNMLNDYSYKYDIIISILRYLHVTSRLVNNIHAQMYTSRLNSSRLMLVTPSCLGTRGAVSSGSMRISAM